LADTAHDSHSLGKQKDRRTQRQPDCDGRDHKAGQQLDKVFVKIGPDRCFFATTASIVRGGDYLRRRLFAASSAHLTLPAGLILRSLLCGLFGCLLFSFKFSVGQSPSRIIGRERRWH
jgi:hypothetical protein